MSLRPVSHRGTPCSTDPAAGQRWLLWVDAAGGFLVLGGDCWAIGGPASDGEAAICVQADLQRQHAYLARSGTDYVLYPAAGRVAYPLSRSAAGGVRAADGGASGAMEGGSGGVELREPAPLRCSDRFALGRSVVCRFVQPSPLSGSARLAVDAPYRLRPHVDAVLLWADALVVGPTLDCHVVVPHAEAAIVLLQRDGAWIAKVSGSDAAANCPAQAVPLPSGRRLQHSGVSLTLEEVTPTG